MKKRPLTSLMRWTTIGESEPANDSTEDAAELSERAVTTKLTRCAFFDEA